MFRSFFRFITSVLLLSGALCVLRLHAVPEPVKVSPPRATGLSTEANGTQIAKLLMGPTNLPPPIRLTRPSGENWSFAFWVRLEDSPLLQESTFSRQAPLTLVDFKTDAPQVSGQRIVIRIMHGNFEVTEQNDGKWRSLKGFGAAATPDTWHFLAYTRTAGEGIFYVNGNICARTAADVRPQTDLQNLILGHFDGLRTPSGILFKPRFYSSVLTFDDVRILAEDGPSEAH